MSRYWNSLISKLEPYVPGEQPRVQNLIKLKCDPQKMQEMEFVTLP